MAYSVNMAIVISSCKVQTCLVYKLSLVQTLGISIDSRATARVTSWATGPYPDPWFTAPRRVLEDGKLWSSGSFKSPSILAAENGVDRLDLAVPFCEKRQSQPSTRLPSRVHVTSSKS